MFSKSIDAFNEVAEMVNKIAPDIEWGSVGDTLQHLYLKRARQDGNFDVLAFCRNLKLENEKSRDVTYFVTKEESFFPKIARVTADGELYPYESCGGYISVTIDVPAGGSRLVAIEYENNLDLTAIKTAKNDLRVNRLRKISDFRDMVLSRNALGRGLIHAYYDTGIYKLGLKRLTVYSIILATIVGVGSWYLTRRACRGWKR